MEETVIVIMLKDRQTGFLEKELGCLKILGHDELIYNSFAEETIDGIEVILKLCCGDREVSDWEFEAIFDYYDSEKILPLVTSIEEEEECYNPTWVIKFPWTEDITQMEEKINKLLSLHAQELTAVYEEIADKKDAYEDEKNV